MKKFNENIGISIDVYNVLAKYQSAAQSAAQTAEELCVALCNAVKTRKEIPALLKFMSSCEYGLFVPAARAALNAAFPPAKKADKPAGKPASKFSNAEQALIDALVALTPDRRKAVLDAVAAKTKEKAA